MGQHFTIEEFRCKDGTPYPAEWVPTRLPALLRLLEAIRHEVGDLPITVLCGYRTPTYNQALRDRGLNGESGRTGVAEHSQHMEGRAADIVCHGMRTAVLHGHIMDAYEAGRLPDLGGVGLYESMGFTHVDTYRLASGALRRWNG